MNPKFHGNLLVWPIARSARTYRVYVVEPEQYSPRQHGKLFQAALNSLLAPKSAPIDAFSETSRVPKAEYFDLITFPEAFLPTDDLLSSLGQISSQLDSIGCVHVGLRPDSSENGHLFQIVKISRLVEELLKIPTIQAEDLDAFREWLKGQHADASFNVGCLFTIDSSKRLRVCLHPKLVRSKFELSPLHEKHMTEANLLTLVTLQPDDRTLFSVTLQPLLCSDMLHLQTDQLLNWPLEGVNAHASCFSISPPDHVDVVSVATCTPQPEVRTSKGDGYRQWHEHFRDSLKRAISDDSLNRHHSAIFVLSNFRTLRESGGGLSGGFIPLGHRGHYPKYVSTSSYGKPKEPEGLDNQWSTPDGKDNVVRTWSILGHLTSLNSSQHPGSPEGYMLGFTVNKLPRDTLRWQGNEGLTDFQLKVATRRDDGLEFTKARET